MDRGAWKAIVYGLEKSQDTTKRLTLNTSLHFTSFLILLPARGKLIPFNTLPFPSLQIWIGLSKLLIMNKMQWK